MISKAILPSLGGWLGQARMRLETKSSPMICFGNSSVIEPPNSYATSNIQQARLPSIGFWSIIRQVKASSVAIANGVSGAMLPGAQRARGQE
jgi:hypothetical protein